MRFFGSLARSFHSQIARSRIASTAYVHLWAIVLRRRSSSRLKNLIVATLESVDWPVERFRTVRCSLFGTGRPTSFAPHPCLVDFMTLFHEEHRWEPEIVDFVRGRLAHVDTVIEFGANVGFFTLFSSQVFADRGAGHVYAFEPAPRTYRALLDNLSVNGVRNVTTLNAAISTGEGVATFYEPTVAAFGDKKLQRSSLVSYHAHWEASEVREYQVFTVGPATIEPLLRSGGRVLMKLDIEMAEAVVLDALQDLVRRYEPDIVLEVLPDACDALNGLSYLAEHYHLVHLTEDGPVERTRFVARPGPHGNDYFLSPRSRTAASQSA